MNRFIMRTAFAVAVVATASISQAGWSLLEDFESSTVGDPLPASYTVTDNVHDLQVAVDPDDASNQALQASDFITGGSSTSNAYLSLGSGIADGTTGTVFFRMRSGGVEDFVFGSSDVAAPTAWGDYEGYMRMAGSPGFNRIDIRDGGGFAFAQLHNPDEWYNIWMVLDNAADTTTLYVSQGAAGAGAAVITGGFRNGTTDAIVTLNMRLTDAHLTTGYMDDIYFDPSGANLANPVPEPGSVALVAVACLLAGVSRRRKS